MAALGVSSVSAMARVTRTPIDTEVDAAHLAQVMRRFGVSEVAAAIDLALEFAASAPATEAELHECRDSDTVEELVSVRSLHRYTSP